MSQWISVDAVEFLFLMCNMHRSALCLACSCRWMYLDDQSLCAPTSSSFVYGAVPIGASIYVVGDLDTGERVAILQHSGSLNF